VEAGADEMTSPEKEDNVEDENQEGENIGDGLA